ncbi:MAG: hypothetical protein ABEJ65_03390 [bacterium]
MDTLKTVRKVGIGSWRYLQTAAIEKQSGGEHVVKIDEDFFDRYLGREHRQGIINSAFVVLHEANHGRRADMSRTFRGIDLRWDQLSNLVSDIYVNAELFQNGFPPRETITSELYNIKRSQFLLIPPHHLIEMYVEDQGEELSLKPYVEIPERLWSDGLAESSMKNDYLYEQFNQFVKPWVRSQVINDLIWKHPENRSRDFERLFESYLDSWFGQMELRDMVRLLDDILRNIRSTTKILGASHGHRGVKGRGLGDTEDLETKQRPAQRKAWFVNILERALTENSRSRKPVRVQDDRKGVVPSPDRSGTFQMSQGTWPVFFNNTLETYRRPNQAAHVYLDSSGSMSDDIVDIVSRLILGSDGLVAEPVYLFTTDVKPVSLKRLKEGYRITGGTAINEPIAHARKKKLSQFILITDGYVEEIVGENQQFLQNSEMFVIFEGQPRRQEHIQKYAEATWKGLNQFMEDGVKPVKIIN